MAWPKVWPKFKIARRSCSRSSRATTVALISQDRADGVGERSGRAPAASRCCVPASRTACGSQTQPYLITSARPALQLAVRQGREHIGIGDDRARLIKGADEILAAGMIDAGLAADRGVHLREQRRRHLHIADAALVAGGRKAAMSPTTPPPSASTVASRFNFLPTSASNTQPAVCRVLCCSPSGSMHSAIRRSRKAARQLARDTSVPRWYW